MKKVLVIKKKEQSFNPCKPTSWMRCEGEIWEDVSLSSCLLAGCIRSIFRPFLRIEVGFFSVSLLNVWVYFSK